MVVHRIANGSDDHGSERELPLDVARECFTLLVTGPNPLSLDGREFRGLPNRLIPLDELRDRMLRRRCPRATRDTVWAHLVRRSHQEGATWTLACAGMAVPALSGVARWLSSRFPGDPFDVHAEVLSGFLSALSTIDLGRPRVLVRLRWAAYRQGFAALSEALDAPTPVAPGFRSAAPRPPWGHPDLVLAKAVRSLVLTRTEADLIGATRLDDMAIADWADRHQTTPGAAYKVRQRAEARLVAFLRDEARDVDPDDPVAASAIDGLSNAGPASDRASGPTHPAPSQSVTPPSAGDVSDRAEKSSIGVSKKGLESGLLRCGSTTPASTSTPPSEVRRCA
ncbi:hypothetical protein [Streptantibioticus ferralitis]|uniref:Sigma-70 family RNA polymerase sigma factor n=1 Tax=Streptantibioticus ferralitis TaxID=236510 RepID=A0ABT5Z3C8_9ACTN|nr:hypothetical protein [Streptantibioticus ferralitis]MDF2258340.1 hypothetical protein [Streptantibioticus ferralitis]